MNDRALHIAALAAILAVFGVVYSLVPKLYAKWQPTGTIEATAHRALGWLGRYFWHIWAIVALTMAIWGGLELNGLLP